MAAATKKKVTFATDWTDPTTGKEHKGGDTASVDAADARMLVHIGRAQLADETPADAVDLTPKTDPKAGK